MQFIKIARNCCVKVGQIQTVLEPTPELLKQCINVSSSWSELPPHTLPSDSLSKYKGIVLTYQNNYIASEVSASKLTSKLAGSYQ